MFEGSNSIDKRVMVSGGKFYQRGNVRRNDGVMCVCGEERGVCVLCVWVCVRVMM